MTDEYIPVRVRECPDGSHPDGDTVWILPKLSLEGGIAARQDLADVAREFPVKTSDFDADGSPLTEAGRAYDHALIRRWMVTFCRYGAVSWDLHDDDGPIAFSVDRLLEDGELGFAVADKADDYYRSAVIRPLAQRASQTSQRGRAASRSTQAPTTSTGSRRASSSRRASAGQRSEAPTP